MGNPPAEAVPAVECGRQKYGEGDGHDHEEREDHPHVALRLEPRRAREEGDDEEEHRVVPPLADLEEEERRVGRGSDGAHQRCSLPQLGR